MKKILLGLTTITEGEWRNKVKEIDELGLKEIALFPTCLNGGERKELYQLLEKTKLKRIPHVHLRDDMEISELDYLSDRFKTEVFNIHSKKSSHPFLHDYKNHVKNVYVENTPDCLLSISELNRYAGLCLDISHWESIILDKGKKRERGQMAKIVKTYKIGINHVSAVKDEPICYHDRFDNQVYVLNGSHWLDDLREVDYVKKYKNYLADIISLELENPLRRQLEVKNHLEEMLKL